MRPGHRGSLIDRSEKIGNLDIERSRELHDRGQGRATLASEDLREVPFREVGL